MKLRIASPITIDSIVDGPGLRMVIWTQGCNHNCNGCHNPQTHNIQEGYEIDTKDIIEDIFKLRLQKGITLSGGEPFLQQEPLEEIAKVAKSRNLDVWCYTGFTMEQLLNKANPSYFRNLNLLKTIDILVDGKFIMDRKDINLKFRGSSNQRIIDVQKSLRLKQVCMAEEYLEKELYEAK